MRMDTIYLDNCCFCRLFDTKTQPKIIAEADKIQNIIDNRIIGGYRIIGSFVVEFEMGDIDDYEKREAVEAVYDDAICDEVELSVQTLARADDLHLMGLGVMDSRHLAAAEAAGAKFLLTTDEKFIRKCANKNLSKVRVINPLDF